MPRDKSHEYYGESMKAQHNCFSDGSGMGKGYEIYLNQQKASYTASELNKKKKTWKQVRGEQWNFQKKHWKGGQQKQWQKQQGWWKHNQWKQ